MTSYQDMPGSTHKDGRRYKKSHDTTAFVTRRRSGPVGRSNLSNGPMEYLPKFLISRLIRSVVRLHS